MKAYLQYRSIVCRKFADIDHLIGDNKLWNEIYSIFRTLKEEHKLSIPAIEVLNEVYLQSMRAFLVKHADEEDIWEGYVFRSRHLKSDSSATQLCLSLVYAALCLMRIPIEQAVEHLQILREKHLMDEHGKPSTFFHSVFVILWQKERKTIETLVSGFSESARLGSCVQPGKFRCGRSAARTGSSCACRHDNRGLDAGNGPFQLRVHQGNRLPLEQEKRAVADIGMHRDVLLQPEGRVSTRYTSVG